MAETSRNAPCPCGSGRKYKRCCGRETRESRSAPARERVGEYLRLHVSLRHASPAVWRRILLRAGASFLELHEAIQALGWTDSHLWRFLDPRSGRGLAGTAAQGWLQESDPDAREVRVDAELREPGDRCLYVYDFGDSWEHDVVLEGVEQRGQRFDRALLDGAGAFPPEDCGGIPGFARLREFLATGRDPWEDDEALREWTQEMSLEEPDLERERRRFGALVEGRSGEPPALEAANPPSAQSGRALAIDEPMVDTIVQETELFLAGLAERLGVVIHLRKASYSEVNASLDVEVATLRDDGVVMDRLAVEFLRRCEDFGFEPGDLGRSFQCFEGTYRIIGLRPRAKQPVICEATGRPAEAGPERVRMSAAMVHSCIGRAKAGG